METQNLEKLKYPVGKFESPQTIDNQLLKQWIDTIAQFPNRVKAAVENLSEAQLDTPYRPGGWTIRQVVHHVADSHANAFIRFKLALTEDNPTIKPYAEDKWAELADAKLPLEPSLQILSGVHQRWLVVLNAMTEADFACTYFHPESQKNFTLKEALGLYDWHSRHHLAHIFQAIG
jgi:uncharacterized damage-inducible protein DinB